MIKKIIHNTIIKIRRLFSPLKFYRNLNDFPFYNWRKLHETGDHSFLIKKGLIKNAKVGELKKEWHKLNNEYLTKYGLDFKTKTMLKDRKKLALALLNFVITLDKSYEMEADILRIDINKNNQVGGKKISYTQLLAEIEESRGYPIDEYKTSTDKFFTYHRIIKERNSKKLNFKAA